MKNLSTTGYKRNSPDKDRPYNVIPSGDITMKNVDFPVDAIDNLGNSKKMKPGRDYRFPGNIVLEFKEGTKGRSKIYNRIFNNQIK